MDDIDCHHSVIPICEIMDSYKKGELTWKQAKELAEDKDNIIFVCKHCHKMMHCSPVKLLTKTLKKYGNN